MGTAGARSGGAATLGGGAAVAGALVGVTPTFRHKGVVEGAGEFGKQLRAYRAVIRTREQRLLEFSADPGTLDEVVSSSTARRDERGTGSEVMPVEVSI